MPSCILAGIGTDVGKTLVSAVLVQAMGWHYWKPVQSGSLQHTDTREVQRLVSRTDVVFHREAYRLNQPLSPHAAAALDGIRIHAETLQPPQSERPLLIELAGGLMVPLREDYLILDWLSTLNLPVILVSRYYLGSINHTLLSLRILQQAGIPLMGLILNGNSVATTRDVILQHGGQPVIAEIPEQPRIDASSVRALGASLNTRVLEEQGFRRIPLP